MYTLGINFSHHSSVALLKDNEVVFFCLEERFNRFKYWGGPKEARGIVGHVFESYPSECLKQIKKFTSTIDIVVGISGKMEQLPAAVNFLKKLGITVTRATMDNQAHHLFHAASVFYVSPFATASCIVMDGLGAITKFNDSTRASETTSVFEISYDRGIHCTYKKLTVGVFDGNNVRKLWQEYPASRKIPINVTEEELDFFNKNFKPKSKFFKAARYDASTEMDIGLIYHSAAMQCGRALGWPGPTNDGKMMGLAGYGGKPDSTEWENLAHETQKELEQYFISLIARCKQNNILIGGGCALNILGNTIIKKIYPLTNIFPDPVAHDGSIALGAAAFHFYRVSKCKEKLVTNAYGGINYNITKDDIYERTRKYSI